MACRYQDKATVRASIVLLFLSIAIFAVFLACKDKCLFYSIGVNYWIPFWTGILGIFLGCLGIAMACSRKGDKRCESTAYFIGIVLLFLASLASMFFTARPIIGPLELDLFNQTSNSLVVFLTDLRYNNGTTVNEQRQSVNYWGAMAGIAVCLALMSLVMFCMYCCCCQNSEAPSHHRTKNPKDTPNRNKEKVVNTQRSAANSNAAVIEFDHIRVITPPTQEETRPPPYAPAITGDSMQDTILFGIASAPHASKSASLQRDIARQQASWGVSSIQTAAESPPELPTSPRPNTLDRPTNDVPPALPTSPRPSRSEETPNTATDPGDDDYVEPNNPATQLETEYNYAYDHDINSLVRNLPLDNSASQRTATDNTAAAGDAAEYIIPIAGEDVADEYNYAYDHDINSLARNQALNNNAGQRAATGDAAGVDDAAEYIVPIAGNEDNNQAQITYY